MNEASTEITVVFDGINWSGFATDGKRLQLEIASESEALLPSIPEEMHVARLLLPLEQQLCRFFSLPLPNPRLVDFEILSQELEERSYEALSDWWLSWRAGQSDGGVRVAVIAMPESLRAAIDADVQWRHAEIVAADGWVRLNSVVASQPQGRNAAVIAVDREGLFFGLRDDAGSWRGMRRLNLNLAEASDDDWQVLFDEMRRSLQAMGWQDDDPVCGRLPEPLHRLWPAHDAIDAPLELSHLSDRTDAVKSETGDGGLNFRHSSWRSRPRQSQWPRWRRSALLAAALVLVWTTGMLWQNFSLGRQLDAGQQQIIAAFHKGLPEEKVLIDAMAQLRRAAGGASGASGAGEWKPHFDAITRAWQQTPWQLREISFRDGRMTLSGQVADLEAVNKIREALKAQTGSDIELVDTDISGDQVRFRMAWS